MGLSMEYLWQINIDDDLGVSKMGDPQMVGL